MKKLAFCLIVGALISGCATPAVNPWVDLTMDTSPAVGPINCGKLPYPSSVSDTNGDGKIDTVSYDEDGSNALEAYRACSEDNKEIITQHAGQIMQLKISRKGLTEAGIAQRNIADMRKTMLEEERRHNFWNNIGLYVVIAGMGLAL